MFRTALTVAASLYAAAALAQDTAGGDAAEPSGGDLPQLSQVITAEMLEDAPIVSLEGQYNENIWEDGSPLTAMVADLKEIGDVDDIVLNAAGQMQGVTTDVGGFLGIGSKQVLIPLEDMRLARPDAGSDDVTIVTRLNQQQLTDLNEFEVEE